LLASDQVPQAALAAAFQPFTNIHGAPALSAKYQRLQKQFAEMDKALKTHVTPASWHACLTGLPCGTLD
jgi:hypothetical protein